MKLRRRLAVFLMLVAFGAETSRAARAIAQAAEPDELETKKQEAKARFLKGVELAEQQSWDAALAEFLASRDVFPTRVALRNIAVCLANLKRYAEAQEAHSELLEKFGEQMSPAEKNQVDAVMAEVRAHIGEIDVKSSPEGGVVVVDGLERGATPLSSPILVNAGTHLVRVSKEGYETSETQVSVAGNQKKALTAKLLRLRHRGTLIVQEAEGRALDVVVDGVVVGKTPWRATLGTGPHSVVLRGEGQLGTPPSSSTIREGETTTLALRAVELDAELQVEPVPSNARVDIDGVPVGAGVWRGRLASGTHVVEVYAEGHLPSRRELAVGAERRNFARVVLERDRSSPIWGGAGSLLYVEVTGAAAWSASFGGGADASCAHDVTIPEGLPGAGTANGCSDRSRPFGVLAGARLGYRLTPGLGLELFAGYVYLGESLTRRIRADYEEPEGVYSADYRDTTKVSGPLAAFSVSYRFFERTPLVLRALGGIARVRVRTTNRGTFSGGELVPLDNELVSIPEDAQNLWLPFAGPEVRIGYRWSERWVASVGVAALWMFPPERLRTGGLSDTGRSAAVGPQGFFTLPAEKSLGSFLVILPGIGLGMDF